MARPLTEFLLDVVSVKAWRGVRVQTLLAICSPDAFTGFLEENSSLPHPSLKEATLATPSGPLRVVADTWAKNPGIVVMETVDFLPVRNFRVSL